MSCRQMEIVLETAGRAAVNASARQGRGKAELTCRFAGSPVRRFAGSPVRRFAGSPVRIRYTYASVDL